MSRSGITRPRVGVLGVVAVLALAAAACGSDNSSSSSATTAAPASAAATTAAGAGTATTAAASATTAAGATTGGPPADAIGVPIGLAFSTGATYGAIDGASQAGAQLAVKEINDAGGFKVNGKDYKLDAHLVDTTDTPAQATAAVQGLMDQYKVVAVFGPTVSSNATATQVVANREKVIEVSAATAWSTILGKPETKYLVKSLTLADDIAKMQNQAFLKKYPDLKTAEILATDEAAGQASAKAYGAALEADGLKVDTTYYPTDMTDFSSIITKLRDNPPDLIMVTGAAQSSMNGMLDKLQDAKLGKLQYGANCGYRQTKQFTADDVPFACTSSPADMPFSQDPAIMKYRAAYEAFTGKPSDGLSFYSLTQYPFVYALVEAMQKAGTVTDTDAIINALHGYASNAHAVGLTIGDDGHATTSLEVSFSGPNNAVEVQRVDPPANS